MSKGTLVFLVACAFALALLAPQANAATINLTFGSGFSGADAETQKGVVEAAADLWEAAILTDFVVNITVQQVDLSGEGAGLLGRTHSNSESAVANPTTGTKLPTAGTVEIASNRLSSFWFDPTPYASEEFDMSQRGGTVGTAVSGSDAVGKYDALSIWIHEMGHVFGFMGGSGDWNDGEPWTVLTDFANNLGGGVYTFDWLTTGTEGNLGDTVAMANSYHTSAGAWLANMNPTFGTGARRLLTPIDIDMIGDAFHLAIDDTPEFGEPIPEPATFALLGLGLLALRLRRRRV